MNPPVSTRLAAALTMLTLSLCATDTRAAVDLPNIGEAAESYLSTGDEQRLGKIFMRDVRRSLEVVDDPELESYVQTLGYRLVANSGIRGQQFTFFVVKDPVINAFAGPGGYIGVNTGLFLTTETEAELASVIAHETAHVTQRHIARAFESASRMSAPMTAAVIAAIILGSKTSQSGQLGEAALAATIAGSAQQQINFTRANEEEADRVGLQFLANSGFDPHAMPVFFGRLLQASQYTDNQQYEFLRTHPMTTSRISDTRNRADQFPEHKDQVNENYLLMRAKVRLLQDNNPQQSAEYFQKLLETAPAVEKDALLYGYALSLHALGRDKEALAQLQSIISKDPERIAYQIALARIELASGQADKALKTYEHSLGLYPFNLPLTSGYVSALLEAGNADQAGAVINEYLRQRGPDAGIYNLLAQTESLRGHSAEAHQALAEYHYLRGETHIAIQQLKIAQRNAPADDEHLQAKIKARLAELEAVWKTEVKFDEEGQKQKDLGKV